MDREAGYFFTIPLPMATPIRAATITPVTSRGGSGGKDGKLRGICREAAGQVEHQHRRERLRSFRRRASAHFHRRSFLKDAPIILLDEATASLDVENETAIQEALSRLIKNKTVLIIAHWMRTVASADQVVVLSGGIVVEQGSPAELYARKELYTHMGDRKTPLPGGGFSSGPSWWRLE